MYRSVEVNAWYVILCSTCGLSHILMEDNNYRRCKASAVHCSRVQSSTDVSRRPTAGCFLFLNESRMNLGVRLALASNASRATWSRRAFGSTTTSRYSSVTYITELRYRSLFCCNDISGGMKNQIVVGSVYDSHYPPPPKIG